MAISEKSIGRFRMNQLSWNDVCPTIPIFIVQLCQCNEKGEGGLAGQYIQVNQDPFGICISI